MRSNCGSVGLSSSHEVTGPTDGAVVDRPACSRRYVSICGWVDDLGFVKGSVEIIILFLIFSIRNIDNISSSIIKDWIILLMWVCV